MTGRPGSAFAGGIALEQLKPFAESIDVAGLVKLVFHAPQKGSPYKKVVGRPVFVRRAAMVQFEQFTEKQAFHRNVPAEGLAEAVCGYLPEHFKKLSVQTRQADYDVYAVPGGVKVVRRGHAEAAAPDVGHDRAKRYLLPEGAVVEPLVDLGVFTAEGKVVKAKYDKYKQINRFLELVDDVTKDMGERKIRIVDFGCGKSYLTFILYYYLKEVCRFDISVVGLDLKREIVDHCNAVAGKYRYEDLKFVAGDIKDYVPDGDIDVVLCLHACDTATDFALYNAIRWNARAILAVPCCQHELNRQMRTDTYSILTKYGVVKERMAALLTDVIRANLLELNDYEVQMLEFVDFEHSPKNLLIRAVKKAMSGAAKERAAREIDAVLKEYHVEPTLCGLLGRPT